MSLPISFKHQMTYMYASLYHCDQTHAVRTVAYVTATQSDLLHMLLLHSPICCICYYYTVRSVSDVTTTQYDLFRMLQNYTVRSVSDVTTTHQQYLHPYYTVGVHAPPHPHTAGLHDRTHPHTAGLHAPSTYLSSSAQPLCTARALESGLLLGCDSPTCLHVSIS